MASLSRFDLRALGALVVLAGAAAAGAACGGSAVGSTADTGRFYGEPLAMGNGTLRSYVVLDDGEPVEIGVAISEDALVDLPQPSHHGGGSHAAMVEFLPPLPPQAAKTPFKLIEVDWNPAGHAAPGIYDVPHFDFHFYTITKAERDRITTDDPEFDEKAVRYPAEQFLPAGHIPVDPVPFMGQHWIDPTSPEFNGQKFTQTFIYGTWDGLMIFQEPMVTKAFIESKPNVATPLVRPQAYQVAGPRPTHYAVRWDAEAREYRIALEGLTAMQE